MKARVKLDPNNSIHVNVCNNKINIREIHQTENYTTPGNGLVIDKETLPRLIKALQHVLGTIS